MSADIILIPQQLQHLDLLQTHPVYQKTDSERKQVYHDDNDTTENEIGKTPC
jgi:hypothetical protein